MSTYLYYKRQKHGLCPRCGRIVENKKYKTCDRCRAYAQQYSHNKTQNETEEQRIARLEVVKKRTTERNTERREKGLCVRCGITPTKHWLCDACAMKVRVARANRRNDGT